MIRVFDKEERYFNHLGYGTLDETTEAIVVEELNGVFELELEYPLSGKHFDKLQLRNIIFCKPNIYSDPQPFRIFAITKPINGIITVNAEHISYDASGVTILPKRNSETKEIESFGVEVEADDKKGFFLNTILNDINQSAALQHKNYFSLIMGNDKENIFKENGFLIEAPMSLRSILGGEENSLIEQFKGEFIFDRYNIILNNKRGIDRGIKVSYGKNLKELEHDSDSNGMFTAIFPFYSKRYTETFTSTQPIFQETYIVQGVTPLRADWLSIELGDMNTMLGSTPLKPIVETVRIFVQGAADMLVPRYVPVVVITGDKADSPNKEFNGRIFVYRKNRTEDGNLLEVFINESIIVDEQQIVTSIKDSNNNVITPKFGNIYIIKDTDSELFNKKLIHEYENGFVRYSSDGFYIEAYDAREYTSEETPLPADLPIYPIIWDNVANEWVRDDIDGKIYVLPRRPNVGTVSVDKYVYVDAIGHPLPETSEVVIDEELIQKVDSENNLVFDEYDNPVMVPSLSNGLMYVNEELKNLENQKILTLDMTSDLDSIEGLSPEKITKETLFNKAEQYLKDNDFTKSNESIIISFTKLSDSPEYAHFKDLEIVELGDEITVVYDELGINSKHRVISTTYNVLSDSYYEIELGKKISKITNSVVTLGDNVSGLKNDADFTNRTYIIDFIAENANIINAQIQNAIIDTLKVAKINVSGLLEASEATIDELVANMLIAENAQVRGLLEAGSIRIAGHITALSGNIGGCEIDSNGNLRITTSIDINGNFQVDEHGDVHANSIILKSATADIINSKELESNSVLTNRLYLSDKNAYLERVTSDGPSETQQVNFNAIVFAFTEEGTNKVSITVSEIDDKILWYNRTIRVSFSYNNGTSWVSTSRELTLEANTIGGNTKTEIYNIEGANFVNSNTISLFPESLTETRVTGTDSKLVVVFDGVQHDIIQEGGGVINDSVRFFLSGNQPISGFKEGDFWYEKDPEPE
ncbi:MAG: phage tail spike protein [Candidatus Izemoplasmataceae bacterium]